MTKPQEDHEFANETRQLLAAVVLGDTTDLQIRRLNDLLLHDEALRHQAARFLEEEAVLRREFEMLYRVVEFHTPLAKDLSDERTRSNSAVASCETRSPNTLRQRLFLAVAVLISAAIGVIWLEHRTRTASSDQAANEAELRLSLLAGRVDDATFRHSTLPIAASILSPVTRVSWSGPRFALEPNAGPLASAMRAGEGVIPSVMREGVTSFTSAFGRPAEGYMIALPPNTLLDLVVAADSLGENALAVIEFDGTGRPTGRRISFSNSGGDGAANPAVLGKVSTRTKQGRLGIWTERNDSAGPRYYLFTGVHKLLNRSADDSWHVSRLLAFVEEPDLFHIGWDDSGMLSTGEQDRVHIPDDDFDDVSATIRIRKVNPEPNGQTVGIHIASKTLAYDADPNQSSLSGLDGYPFSVAPGQVAVLKVCSRSGALVEMVVLEKDADKVRWRCRKEYVHSPTLGICTIENHTLAAQEFVIIGHKRIPTANAQTSSRPLLHSVLFEKEQLVTIGFDDGQQVSDFDKVRVDILTMDEL